MWRRSTAAPGQPSTGTWWLNVWWGCLLGAGLLSRASVALRDEASSASGLAGAYQSGAVADVLLAVAAVAAIRLVQPITDGQERRRLGAVATAADGEGQTAASSASMSASMRRLPIAVPVVLGVLSVGTGAALFRDATGTPITTEVAESIEEPGTCVRFSADAMGGSEREAVPCEEPHNGEVIAVPLMFFGEGAPYPDRERLFEQAEIRCTSEFEPWVGTSTDESELELYAIVPSQLQWMSGDRTAECIAVQPVGATLVGSVRGTAR